MRCVFCVAGKGCDVHLSSAAIHSLTLNVSDVHALLSLLLTKCASEGARARDLSL